MATKTNQFTDPHSKEKSTTNYPTVIQNTKNVWWTENSNLLQIFNSNLTTQLKYEDVILVTVEINSRKENSKNKIELFKVYVDNNIEFEEFGMVVACFRQNSV